MEGDSGLRDERESEEDENEAEDLRRKYDSGETTLAQ